MSKNANKGAKNRVTRRNNVVLPSDDNVRDRSPIRSLEEEEEDEALARKAALRSAAAARMSASGSSSPSVDVASIVRAALKDELPSLIVETAKENS